MANEGSLVPEGSVTIAGTDVNYTTLVAFGVGILIGMIFKS